MLSDKYNYSLNGIEHEILINSNLKIDQKPINEKILVSNKYLLKYINDLFDYYSIEYCLINNTLLGSFVFNGINIFNQSLEICTLDSNFAKIKRLEEEIKNDGFEIIFNEKNILISTTFFDKIKTYIYIYPMENIINQDELSYTTFDNKQIIHKFYDIFPIKKKIFEEYEISVPNKIENVLNTYQFDLNYISFTKKKNDNKKIIEEIDEKSTINNHIKDIFNNAYSIIKPFFSSEP